MSTKHHSLFAIARQHTLLCCASLVLVLTAHTAIGDEYFIDFSTNPKFEYMIHPNLPRYDFRLIGRAFDEGRSVVDKIIVSRTDKPEPWQILNVPEMYPIPKAANNSYFIAEDLNFDGYLDIGLLTNLAMVNSTSYYWVFNIQTRKYEALGEYQTLRLIPAKKELWTYNRGGNAGLLWSAARYKYLNGKLIAVETQQQDFDENNNRYIRTTSKRTNEKLVIVKREFFKEDVATPGATWEK
jgi:hypothetical protein